MVEFDYVTFGILVAIIVAIGLLMLYFLKRLPGYVRKESPRKAEEHLKDEAFNALNTLSSLVRMARQQGKPVDVVTPMLRDARSAYDSGDYEGARRTASMGKEVLRTTGLSLSKKIVKAGKEEKEDQDEADVEEEEEPARAVQAPKERPTPAPTPFVPPTAPAPIARPTLANGGEDESPADGEEKSDDDEFETPASVLRRAKPKNYMEAKFMILQVENFLSTEERAGRINKEARRDLEESKRHFKDGDFDMSLALSARAKRATGKTDEFVKVTEKATDAPLADGAEARKDPGTGGPAPPPIQRAPSAAARAAQAATSRVCGNCGAQVVAKDKFCRECGATAGRQCAKCGETLEVKDKFCGNCGGKG
ncbi:MAG TPA: zinc ribbon domain-containing protein [Thermoplasmata archaeon]|nr:zinc ribbon domain-containing protein [Thermoplasmata archaeon]